MKNYRTKQNAFLATVAWLSALYGTQAPPQILFSVRMTFSRPSTIALPVTH